MLNIVFVARLIEPLNIRGSSRAIRDITTAAVSCNSTFRTEEQTYKMTSKSSKVRPFVSGRKKYAQIVAINIQHAKKNQVP